MIEFKDRIATYPGRVKLTPVDGQTDTFDMVRADVPIESGTPVNKALFDGITGRIEDAIQVIDNKIFEMTQRVEVGNLSVGASFGLYENGVLVPYYKLENNYGGSGRVLVVRANLTHIAVLYNQDYPYYANNSVDPWMNGEFLARLDSATQNVISEVGIDAIGVMGVQTLYRKVFLLSLQEYQAYGVAEALGQASPMFNSKAKRVATYNGSLVAHHTRDTSPMSGTSGIIDVEGTGWLLSKLTTAGVRPAFTLPPTFEVTAGVPSTKNTMATAEVI
jgi:hypothetical protein